jgi:hypothetical protein
VCLFLGVVVSKLFPFFSPPPLLLVVSDSDTRHNSVVVVLALFVSSSKRMIRVGKSSVTGFGGYNLSTVESTLASDSKKRSP